MLFRSITDRPRIPWFQRSCISYGWVDLSELVCTYAELHLNLVIQFGPLQRADLLWLCTQIESFGLTQLHRT